MGYNHLMQMLQVVLNFWLNISEHLFESILQATQLVQLCHLFSQQSLDLRLANNLYLKALTRNVEGKTNFPMLRCYIWCRVCSRLFQKMFLFHWKFKNLGNYDVSFKWTTMFLSLTEVAKAAVWANVKTFGKFYNKPVKDNNFGNVLFTNSL